MLFKSQKAQENRLFLFDLPKEDNISQLITSYLKDKTNITLKMKPKVIRDQDYAFYKAIITVPKKADFEFACQQLRHFELVPGKPSRALPHNKDLNDAQMQQQADKIIFVGKIPEQMTSLVLETLFSKYGAIS